MDWYLFLDPCVIAALEAKAEVTRHTQVKREKKKANSVTRFQ